MQIYKIFQLANKSIQVSNTHNDLQKDTKSTSSDRNELFIQQEPHFVQQHHNLIQFTIKQQFIIIFYPIFAP